MYSANYLEKVLIATIKDMGSCLCPRCLVPKGLFDYLGLVKDMRSRLTNLQVYAMAKVIKAREFIYQLGNIVDGAKVEDALREGSWVPTLNQFINKLGPLSLDPFHMLVVDIMHECELGTWKALFMHLLRLLYALPGGAQAIVTLDTRFRQVPTYGNGVIYKFSINTSKMKKLAAHDFEDILQCAIPVFEGLFPPDHDAAIQSLLYQFVQWHALTKLRLHCNSTLVFLDEIFKKLSRNLWKFQAHTCTAFNTTELPKEKAKWLAKHSETGNAPPESKLSDSLELLTPLPPKSCVSTAFHEFKPEVFAQGELAHRALKAFYPLTNKLDTPVQLAKHECRRHVLQRVAEVGGTSPSISLSPVDAPSSGKHHHIAVSQNNTVPLFTLLQEHTDNLALKNFIPKLKDHLLYRLRKLDISYCNHTMQVHYTTYDMRHEYDTINPRTHGDIMVLLGETAPNHPYWGTPVKHHLEVLWVRWLALLRNHKSGMKCAHLPRVAFVDESDTDTFGFLDPGQVIQGAHLIPAFNLGRGVSSLRGGKSLARPDGALDDWEVYCVGIIVDAVDNSNSVVLQGDVGYREDSDSEGYEGYDDEKEASDEEFSNEELEEEWEDEGSEIEDGCEEDGHEIEDEFNDLPSF
ncbi:uncharacterized protein BJ212DRAFT_1481109 [Suillus subaureus]|uniref:Uncharacterized protein n=1 Tax=Suillus subaureus TaxID=48587 RepID=A0A9P7EB62_9AGAM|nr:uncharacterized protein BJ212DRAFT_1481109 [Suillus subaureus]KAG1816036.1 hypothetical protein BJ212DRAFT_1481109 [Suillus subaureus]